MKAALLIFAKTPKSSITPNDSLKNARTADITEAFLSLPPHPFLCSSLYFGFCEVCVVDELKCLTR